MLMLPDEWSGRALGDGHGLQQERDASRRALLSGSRNRVVRHEGRALMTMKEQVEQATRDLRGGGDMGSLHELLRRLAAAATDVAAEDYEAGLAVSGALTEVERLSRALEQVRNHLDAVRSQVAERWARSSKMRRTAVRVEAVAWDEESLVVDVVVPDLRPRAFRIPVSMIDNGRILNAVEATVGHDEWLPLYLLAEVAFGEPEDGEREASTYASGYPHMRKFEVAPESLWSDEDGASGSAALVGKPLRRKAYGSIPHLRESRMGPSEERVHDGQERICTIQARDRHDRIIVTEKLDGANVAIANIGGTLYPVGRKGYPTASSPYEHIRMFGRWVMSNLARFESMLEPGETLHGEWMALAHGTLYDLEHEPFVAFDLMRDGNRVPWSDLEARCAAFDVVTPRLISAGPPLAVKDLLPLIEVSGHGVAEGEMVEGAVWRVERRSEFDFMAKWVRPEKVDGKYLPEISGKPEIWLWKPE